jgi:hypothetical protein
MKDLEHNHQVAFLNWFNGIEKFRDLIIFAIPNGGKRNIKTAIKLKKEGVLSGVSDIQILLPNGKTVFIEMKHEKGKLSDSQIEFINRAESLGHTVIVAYSCTEASQKFIEFIKNVK